MNQHMPSDPQCTAGPTKQEPAPGPINPHPTHKNRTWASTWVQPRAVVLSSWLPAYGTGLATQGAQGQQRCCHPCHPKGAGAGPRPHRAPSLRGEAARQSAGEEGERAASRLLSLCTYLPVRLLNANYKRCDPSDLYFFFHQVVPAGS